MKLTLDHTQRLNLHALLGAQRADVGSIRAIWAIQDSIALDADEEKAVELKREMVAGREHVMWNPTRSVPPKEFEFSDPEIARIKMAVQTWDSYSAVADRCWLEPLLLVFSDSPCQPTCPHSSEGTLCVSGGRYWYRQVENGGADHAAIGMLRVSPVAGFGPLSRLSWHCTQ